MMQRMQQVCKDCSGEGKYQHFYLLKTILSIFIGEIINERDRCKTCHGKKTIDQKKKLEVVISPG
jgi:DnaJ-class molecular chaperone